MNTESIKSSSKQIINNLPENDFNIIVYEMADLFNKSSKEGQNWKILNYLNNHNITSQEIYSWLLNNQDDSNAIFLLGVFNYLGIETSVNEQKAFDLYLKAATLGNVLGISELGNCYKEGIGICIDNQKAFELHQKAASSGNAAGI